MTRSKYLVVFQIQHLDLMACKSRAFNSSRPNFVQYEHDHVFKTLLCVVPKGVGPSTTLAWSGWKQPDLAVEVDTARLETSLFKKCCENCVLLYYPRTEFKSAFNVY
jgi:hypothetical protein